MDPEDMTPPPTPPRVAFDPPLFLQRRTAVFDLLTQIHKLPRFNGKLRSLLDVGCGAECLLLGSLIPPNDDLPLEQVTGIDMDDSLHDPALVHTLGPDGVQAGNEGRWRKFGLTLLHGTFERLSLQNLAYHDIIVSAEVIEHLDPGPLANFGSTLLGKLKPKVCIVTTPNRDFNDLFTLPFTPASDTPLDSPGKEVSEPVIALGEIVDPNQLAPATPSKLPVPDPHKNLWDSLAPGDVCSSGDRYWRAGVPYGMRHPDHRFEWSRQEFRQWASNVAEEFGYDVTFTGVGGLGNGMYVIGSTGWAVGEALAKGCGYSHDDSQASESPNQGVLTKANEVWGDCTQIAVFTVREDIADDLAELVEVEDWSRKQANVDNSVANSPLNPYFFPNPITQVVHHNFPYSTDEEFPPSFLTIMELLEKELASYLPTRILEQWNKSASEYSQSQTFQRSKPEGSDSDNEYLFESDSECDYNWNPEIDGDENARKARRKERRYEKKTRRQVENAVLGDRRAEFIKVVKVMGVDLKTLWEGSMGGRKGLRRLCRYRESVFRSVLMNGWREMLNSAVVGEKSENGVFCRAIIDTTDIYKVPEGQEDSDYISGEAPTRRRKMSFSRTMTYSSEASSPTKQRQLLFPPSVSLTPPPAAVRPQTSQGAKLTSHVFTSYVCPSPTGDLLVPGQESPSRPDFGSRRRSWSMPPSPTTATLPSGDSPAAQTPSPSPRLPLTRAHSSSTIPRTSTPHTTSSKPDDLPVQLESETKMVVKLFSASATRSVIDLIRRDLTEEDRHCLKKWKIVKVEFNPELPVEDKDMPSQEEPKHNEVKVVQWNDGPKKEEPQGEEDWELPPAVPPDVVGSWDAWETVATDVFGGDNAGDIYTSDESFPDDTSTAGSSYSHELDGLTHHNEPPPWFEDGKTGGALKSLRTELIYPLVDVDTALSIDKGKQREQDPAQADLDSFLTANKTFENNDKGVLKMDWRSYAGSREKVGRWMQERRRLVLEHNEAVAVLVATGVPNERIPKRKELPTWEEWLAQVEKQEEDPSGGDVGMQEKVPVGIVVYRPAGRDEEEVFVEVFEEEVFEEEKPAMVMGPEEVQEHAMSMMQMEMPLPQGVSALRRGSMVGVMGIGAVPGDALGTSPGRGGAFGHWTGFGSTG